MVRMDRRVTKPSLEKLNETIVSTMKSVYDLFKKDFQQVGGVWWEFVGQIQSRVDKALRQALKRSFNRLSDAINGDGLQAGSGEAQAALFFVHVELSDTDYEKKAPTLNPSVDDLEKLIEGTQRDLTKCIQVVTCLEPALRAIIEKERHEEEMEMYGAVSEEEGADQLEEKPPARKKKLPNYFSSIKDDRSIRDAMVASYKGIQRVKEEVETFLEKHWTLQFERLWRSNREFITKRLTYNKPASQYNQMYQRYSVYLRSVEKKPVSETIGYLHLDFSRLRTQLREQAESVLRTVLEVLHAQAKKGLDAIYDTMRSNTKTLVERVRDQDQLRRKLELLRKCNVDVQRPEPEPATEEGQEPTIRPSPLESRCEPVRQYYDVLKMHARQKYEKRQFLLAAELKLLDELPKEMEKYSEVIETSEVRLQQLKAEFKIRLVQKLDSFEKNVVSLKDELATKGPFGLKSKLGDPQDIIDEFKRRLNSFMSSQKKLREGTKMFLIPMRNFKELREIQKTLQLLEQVWGYRNEWDDTWSKWKQRVFRELDIEEMKKTAGMIISNVNGLLRECGDWQVWKSLQAGLNRFRNTLPLLMDLKHEAMRERHWDKLHKIIHEDFDHEGDDFNLNRIMELNFESYTEDIRLIATAARQELNIERDLDSIVAHWNKIELTLAVFKGENLKILDVEPIFQQLDEDCATLGVMKVNPFIKSFLTEAQDWEKKLSQISEILEMLMRLQETWMYLLNIFVVEDMKIQLKVEAAEFFKLNCVWRSTLQEMRERRTVLSGLTKVGLKGHLMEVSDDLNYIRKQLDGFLRVKRTEFPRFYFLSDRDLLEILGHSKDPQAVQKHLQNCFGGIHRLDIQKATEGRKSGVASVACGFSSKEGERVSLVRRIPLKGPVQKWLLEVEKGMRGAVRKHLKACVTGLETRKRDREAWIQESAGQLTILSAELFWTRRVEAVLGKMASGRGKKNALRNLGRRTWERYLTRYREIIRSRGLDPLTRAKLIALITIEVHHKDVLDSLAKAGVSRLDDFDWEKQLRFYLSSDDEKSAVLVRQTSATLDYAYEYVGPAPRLVITPLTERCYMTLTTALHLSRGGNPKGPAGTGKTETVKDLARSLGQYCLVFNCSRSLGIRSMARMFSGLVQCGAWSCFDEFNRIEVEVLSVIAQYIQKIITAISEKATNFLFDGRDILLNPACGIFCTMNPGYAGRTELPDNLKALLRPIAMMRPDAWMICEIVLDAQGFTTSRPLAKKIVTLFDLMKQQLSKQKHYDFGLRAIKAVLTAAGDLKRRPAYRRAEEDAVLMQACLDMSLPKLVSSDILLFQALVGDLFPGVTAQPKDLRLLENSLRNCLLEFKMQPHPYVIQKAIQLYETKLTRHGVMVVGQTCSGKSTCWQMLEKALTRLQKESGDEDVPLLHAFRKVRHRIINPKALSNEELYGMYTKAREWKNGVLSHIMQKACKDETPAEKWIVFDGPVDTLWIESMNTVLDDSKILTLISGERIRLSETVSLLFEVENLASASPATVSRCGMVFFDRTKLGWEPFYKTWVAEKLKGSEGPNRKKLEALFSGVFHSYVTRALLARESCTEIVTTDEVNAVRSLCRLFDALATERNGLIRGVEGYYPLLSKFFVLALIWSIGGVVDEPGRKRLDMLFREFDPHFPSKDTVFEYYIDEKTKNWRPWEELIQKSWKPPKDVDYSEVMVPTIDTHRNHFVISSLIEANRNVLVVGNTGTGKTSIVKHSLSSLPDRLFSSTTINLSARTSSQKVQAMIEAKVEKKTFDSFAPPSGKDLVIFMDEFNMPQKDQYGSQPPLELIRQWLDYGFWYNRSTQAMQRITKVRLVAAMGPPGGGRERISKRLQSRFNVINVTFPADQTLQRIYLTLLNHRLDSVEEVKRIAQQVVDSTIDIYKTVTTNLRPTPAKSHYLFNLRDLSKVVYGILMADHEQMDTIKQMQRLWVHECYRVFYDRLIDDEDRSWFRGEMEGKLLSVFRSNWKSLFSKSHNPYPFGTVITSTYQEMRDMSKLNQTIGEYLNLHNMEIGLNPMNLVLFTDAVDHVCRIARILRLRRGNALLVGVGGSGRSSLARLAAYICKMDVFEIEVKSSYELADFHDSLKDLFRKCGFENRDVALLVKDSQFPEDYFLEDINNILSSGEVPNLFDGDEVEDIYKQVRIDAIQEDYDDTPSACLQFFLTTVKKHLRVVVCMSPVGAAFRRRLRQFPALVSCTTIDWFSDWPASALKEVALSFLRKMDFTGVALQEVEKPKEKRFREFEEEEGEVGSPSEDSEEEEEEGEAVDIPSILADIFVRCHLQAIDEAQAMKDDVNRIYYVTPSNFLRLLATYTTNLQETRKRIGAEEEKLDKGVKTLDQASEDVAEMRVDLAAQRVKVAEADTECDRLTTKISEERVDLQQKKEEVERKQMEIEEEKKVGEKNSAEAERALSLAQPRLEEALARVDNIDQSDIYEIRSLLKPPDNVVLVLRAVMTVLKRRATFDEAKSQMRNPNQFRKKIINYDHRQMSERLLQRLRKFVEEPKFKPEVVGQTSAALHDLCKWVIASEEYGSVLQRVMPMEELVAKNRRVVQALQKRLDTAKKELRELNEGLQELERQLALRQEEKKDITKKKEQTERSIRLATQLVDGLKSERMQWRDKIANYQKKLGSLPGDVILAAGFLSYCGPFDRSYRQHLLTTWKDIISDCRIPFDRDFSPVDFLIDPVRRLQWGLEGLPSDNYSMANGALVTRSGKWALMIDPQGQANRWVRNLEAKSLYVGNLDQSDFLRELENSILHGRPVLIEDVQEDNMDPSLDGVIGREIYSKGNREVIKLGEKELDVNPEFRLYMTTKLANPHFPPELCARTTIVNFTVTKDGLQEQLLGAVVMRENSDLEKQKKEIVESVADCNRRRVDLENDILKMITTTEELLSEDVIGLLQQSKDTADTLKEQLTRSVVTGKRIDELRDAYRPAAVRSSILYFVLCDLSRVDPMYQFSLEKYVELFQRSIDNSERPKRKSISLRVRLLNDFHTYEVYKTTCQALFEKHKLLFSFQMCGQILLQKGEIDPSEYDFFLRGGVVLDKESGFSSQIDWLPENAWDNFFQLNKLSRFHELVSNIEENDDDWETWYKAKEPENEQLPSEWQSKVGLWERMLLIRCCREDRLISLIKQFIVQKMGRGREGVGERYVSPPTNKLDMVYSGSNEFTPIIFILSKGVDPMDSLTKFSLKKKAKLNTLALGQSQEGRAEMLFEESVRYGHWLYLANCHLMMSWMPSLAKLILERLPLLQPHEDFRLWLSSKPHPKFPIPILQNSLKITTEPSTGIRNNMLRLYEESLSAEEVDQVDVRLQKSFFSLALYHSVLLERAKFGNLGWNIVYDFNDSDFVVCKEILAEYLLRKSTVNWSAIRFLIGEISYGGRVTDDHDRLLLRIYTKTAFNETMITEPQYRLSDEPRFYKLPRDSHLTRSLTIKSIDEFPGDDPPLVFGQHSNADISSQIANSTTLLEQLVRINPHRALVSKIADEWGDEDDKDIVQDPVQVMASGFLEEKVPDDINLEVAAHDTSAMNTVLLQESAKYNSLLRLIRTQLSRLVSAIKGEVVMSGELELIYDDLLETRVPTSWLKSYPSKKNLVSWFLDLNLRIVQMRTWAEGETPKIYWLPGFIFPSGFLTALKQRAAREKKTSVDLLSFEFTIMNEEDVTRVPREGAFVRGLILEGAGWDYSLKCLCEPNPMQLSVPMPVIHFRPVLMTKAKKRAMAVEFGEVYSCPVYYYPIRRQETFVVNVELRCSDGTTAEHWMKRGTAMLLSDAL